MYKLLLILTIFFISNASAKSINTDSTMIFQEILKDSKIYIDRTKSLNIDEIRRRDSLFVSNNKSMLSYGYSPNFDVWIKFTVKNNSDKIIQKILEYANPLTTHITLYDQKYDDIKKDGLFQINVKRKTVNPFFELKLDAYEERTYYLKASSTITTMIIELNLWDTQSFYSQELQHQAILQLFFGAMVVLAIYNLFIYFFTKDISYFFYVLYIFGILMHHLMYAGISYIYLLDENSIKLYIELAVLIVSFPALCLALFTKYFLKTSKYKKLDLVLNLFMVLIVLSALFFLVNKDFNQYRNLLPSCLLIYLMFITIYAVFRKNREAKFILVGWLIFLSAGLVMYLSSVGVFDVFNSFPYLVEVLLLLEAILFSIALADKINHLQIQRDTINKKLIIQQHTEKQRLKSEVEIKTHALQKALNEQTTLLRELNHRVKNNMQTIISLVRLQADEVENEEIQEIFITIQNRISAMSYLHELLYKNSDISSVNTHEYFEILIDNLQDSFENEITIYYEINVNLKVQTAISCGLILNELIINSFKYAFDDDEGYIKVELYKENQEYFFNVTDNGKGYIQGTREQSFGLILVSTLVEDHLQGTINTKTTGGVSNEIRWREDD